MSIESEESLVEELSPEFRKILEEERDMRRAWNMVDAMLEEETSLDIKRAYRKAIGWVKENPEPIGELENE